MAADLKSKQLIQSSRADVGVKLELGATRARATTARSRNHFANAMPRIDTGRPVYTRARREDGRPSTSSFGGRG